MKPPQPNQILLNQKKQHKRVLWFLLIITITVSLIATQLGALPINLWALINGTLDDYLINIWFDIRLPRVLMAVIIGSGLALSGAVLQGLFRNPLADPGLLGISSGAALMVGVAILLLPILSLQDSGLNKHVMFFIKQYSMIIAAFIGGISVALILFSFSKNKQTSLIRLLLLGIAINAVSGGLIGLFTYLSTDTQLRQFSLWTLGSLSNSSLTSLFVTSIIIIPASIALLWFANKLNLLQLGQEQAYYLGIDVNKTQWQVLLLCTLIVAVSVSMTGIIGFIGLVIPHLLRLKFGADHKFLLPSSLICGGLFLLLCDTLARTILIPAEMPVGIITSLVGGPYFIYLIITMKPNGIE
ncbi:FecCD family ABC transporter permease [Thorsellia anophelis]|uniref:Iron complex transport system permease protein n=1 Tax=Thorsellia anophelis DSM 18579 TaxID=1123402 RepID=A0A1I0EE25_9GAMM|nr:iron ABC transporter permease [Thorsellia anophelis]SET43304.1 iron complex transport system permease protein [Thorsellia anophelis DSM 18579]